MNKILIIGNGPSLLNREKGKKIDNFQGGIVRFNYYEIEGYEKWVGTRTDIWVAGQKALENAKKKYVFVFIYLTSPSQEFCNDIQNANLDNEIALFPREDINNLADKTGNHRSKWPTSGLATIEAFVIRGFDVYIHGFDFTPGHNYYDKNIIEEHKKATSLCHEPTKEKVYIEKLIGEGKVHLFL